MEKIRKELDRLDEEIASAEKDLARAEGVIESEKRRLKEMAVEYEKAGEVLKSLDTQLKKIESEVSSKMAEMKEAYEW